ncbi:MAG: NAD-dependent epimerase/dehydratase family protein [Actinomycetota bacterium]
MNVVVTGGAGFIGSNLVDLLANSNLAPPVTVLDDLSSGLSANLSGSRARFVHGSILDSETLDEVVAGADAIVHLAARPSVPRSIAEPKAAHLVNATGTLEVLEAARRHGNPHVIVASSSSVYGANKALPKHEGLAPRPVSPYAASKLASEAYTLAWGHSYDLPILAFRFFNVFGPRQRAGHAYAAASPTFVDAALGNQPLPVYGDGSQSRDFTYVESVCRVIADALERRVTSNEPVNLAFGSNITLNSVIDRIESHLGVRVGVDRKPARAGDGPHSQADNSRLKALFPTIEPVDFDDGLTRTIDWFRSL